MLLSILLLETTGTTSKPVVWELFREHKYENAKTSIEKKKKRSKIMQKFIVIYMYIKTCLAVSKGYNFILMFVSTWSLVSPCEWRREVNLSVTFQLTRSGWISQIWRLAQIRDGSWWSSALTSAWRTPWRRQNKTGPYSLVFPPHAEDASSGIVLRRVVSQENVRKERETKSSRCADEWQQEARSFFKQGRDWDCSCIF